MNCKSIIPLLLTAAFCAGCTTVKPVKAVTPNASPEAVALLNYIRSLSGKHVLTGQHNYPATKDASTQRATEVYGKVPAVYGQDFGFAAAGDKDAVTARPDIIAEIKRKHDMGAIITLCWHAVRPTDNEPVTFKESVQGKLTDKEWNDLITPGTDLYNRWCAQVDVIAGYLKQLQDARIPVLWRPYHEMNGDWFWWGGRRGPRGTTVLYRQIFDRLANHHKLNNLVWVWSVDRPTRADRHFKDYNPGSAYFDIASLDVYHSDYAQSYYNELHRQAAGKPIALAEVGPPPKLDVLKHQPQWTWWMLWAEMVQPGPAGNLVKAVYDDPMSWSLSDPDYLKSITPLRAACGLEPLMK